MANDEPSTNGAKPSKDLITDTVAAVKTVDKAFSLHTEPIDGVELNDATTVPASDPTDGYQSPWERRDTESNYMWDLFTHYRDSGLSRSYRATREWAMKNREKWADQAKVKAKLSYTKPNISNYSRKHDWRERVTQFDDEQERLYQLARGEKIREMADRHATDIMDAIEALMVPSQALMLAVEDNPDYLKNLSKENANKLVAMVASSARVIPNLMSAERLARGMPTEIVAGSVEHTHNLAVERSQIGEILAVLGEANALNVGRTDSGPGEIVDAEVVEVHSVPSDDNDDT